MIAANAGRYPISAQCEILGVPRSACCSMRGCRDEPKQPDPLTPEVFLAYGSNRGAYGARKIKAVLERRGFCASRRRIGRIMKESGLVGAYAKAEFKAHVGNPNEADLPNIVAREFEGHAPHTHVVSDLTYVRVGGRWNYVCLLVDLHNREIVGHAAGEHKGTKLVKSAFATISFPLTDIDVFRTDRGGEFDNIAIDDMLEAFDIKRSLSKKGCPYDNAVDESTNKILKAEFIYKERFSTLYELQLKLNDYVHWYNHFRLHSKLGYMSPVEFRKAGLSL